MGIWRRVFFLVYVTIIVLLVTRTSATRVSKGDEAFFGNDRLWNSRLPRGPVPPSGPSPCHNMLGPNYKPNEFVSPQDEIICP